MVTKLNKKYGELKHFNVLCNKCNKEFDVEEREKIFPKKEKYYCSRSCANSRIHSEETKQKIKKTLTEFNELTNVNLEFAFLTGVNGMIL